MKKLSWILYMVGLLGAAVVGALEGFGSMPEYTWVPYVLVIVGLLIGFMNVTAKEAVAVMIAALVLGGSTGVLALLPTVGEVLEAILVKIAFLSIPIAIPVAVKVLIDKAK